MKSEKDRREFEKAYGLPPKLPDDSEAITIPLATYQAMLRKIERLERQAAHDSWKLNPDRMGS